MANSFQRKSDQVIAHTAKLFGVAMKKTAISGRFFVLVPSCARVLAVPLRILNSAEFFRQLRAHSPWLNPVS